MHAGFLGTVNSAAGYQFEVMRVQEQGLWSTEQRDGEMRYILGGSMFRTALIMGQLKEARVNKRFNGVLFCLELLCS